LSDIGSIYDTIGKESEYSPYALDLYFNCNHKCKYCYVKWNRQRKIRPLLNIDAELRRMAFMGNNGVVTLSFVADPYDRGREDNSKTRQVLELFRKYNHPFQILTKGGTQSASDFDLYKPEDRYGATLTFDNDQDSVAWEPGAALPQDRIESLQLAHEKGIKTWVNLEPVINPEQTLHMIELTHEFVDYYWVGYWNYDTRANEIDWKEFRNDVQSLLWRFKKPYTIKKELRRI
jgi:DNA repair photolyase